MHVKMQIPFDSNYIVETGIHSAVIRIYKWKHNMKFYILNCIWNPKPNSSSTGT